MAGFLLRPGFGVVGDDLRIDALWRVHDDGPCFPGRRIKSQEYILWRRVAGGLTRERQTRLVAGEIERIRSGKAPDERTFTLQGQVQSVDAPHQQVVVKHEEITGYMMAMTMPYKVQSSGMLDRTPRT